MSDDEDSLIEELGAALAAIVLAAFMLLRSGINYAALVEALRNRDTDAAIEALNIDRGAFSPYLLERQSAFAKAGTMVSDGLAKDRNALLKVREPEVRQPRRRDPEARAPGAFAPPAAPPAPPPSPPVAAPSAPGSGGPPSPPSPPVLQAPGGGEIVFRFDMTNPRAETRIRTEAASRVAGYVDEQVEAARRVIADGFQRGEGPQTIATDIAGRINPISGKREGGIVGLSEPQVGYVESMRRRLLSSDPDEMLKVLGRFTKDGKWVEGTGMTLRDRRFDRSIKKAISDVAAGKPNPLSRERVDEMAAKYSDRLLRRRAEDIARTETAQGVMAARSEATRQALDKSGLADEAVTKTWRHNGGPEHARSWHLAMNRRTVTGIDAIFFMPDGSLMQHSHDPAGGVRNNVNCRCSTDYDIDWAFGL